MNILPLIFLAAAPLLPLEQTLDLSPSVKMQLRLIEPGTFIMGDNQGNPNEKPAHRVTIDHPFFIGVTEVTQVQWHAVMGDNPSQYKGETLPVDHVSFHDATNFVAKINALPSLPKSTRCRLPTEEEWEYCCKAGSKTRFYSGDDDADLSTAGWFRGNSLRSRFNPVRFWKGDGGGTRPVATLKPNAWGLYDMHGNLYEWCQDTWPNGMHAIRGGCWWSISLDARSSYRAAYPADTRCEYVGFRVILESTEP